MPTYSWQDQDQELINLLNEYEKANKRSVEIYSTVFQGEQLEGYKKEMEFHLRALLRLVSMDRDEELTTELKKTIRSVTTAIELANGEAEIMVQAITAIKFGDLASA